MLNNVTLIGRLTKDVELRYTQTGVAVARFTVAVNRAFSNQQGEKDADFISCVAWRKTAENLANFMSKGSQIGIVGRIQTGSFDDKDGKRVYTTEVVANEISFLDAKQQGGNQGGQQRKSVQSQGGGSPNASQGYQQPNYQQPQQSYQQPSYQQPQQDYPPLADDDLPF